ncbi:Integrator complex subunit 5 [Pseudolycoriella hygida]|uniref:Integrator complex subunit 5 n=1 Tax=Pseudolycoriella hygida TaxID=35572 RepID=A0A9Q0MUN2_9DIPT|nr:Integrator complex subunit 5 [Pseudolycoriella hygida]
MTSNQSLLNELKYFVNGVPNLHRGLPPDVSAQLVKCSLTMLEELSTCREVILEYFAMVFDESVKNYERDPQGPPPDDEIIVTIQESLENLVTKGPSAWAPLISSWSLRILGTLSNKYSRGRVMDIGKACTLWLGSNAMRCLLGLAALCFGKLYSKDTDDCIATLLNTFVQNSPHFDWVVARLGGCFPLKVISKILQCGLRGFVGNANSTLDSEVGILGYLSFAYESDLKFALNEMLQAVLITNFASIQPQISTIPYLLHLSNMSDILLQLIINVFLDLCKLQIKECCDTAQENSSFNKISVNDSLIPSLIDQSQLWPQNFKPQNIIPLLTSLSLKLRNDATKTIITLAKIAENHAWCQDLLESILQELESFVWENRSCPLLTDLTKDDSTETLWDSCLSSNLFQQQTAVRLLLLASPQAPYIFHQTVAKLLEKSYVINNNGLGALIRILSSHVEIPEPLQVKPGIEMALERLILGSNRKRNDYAATGLNILKNLVSLIQIEKLNTSPHLNRSLVTTTVTDCIPKILMIQSLLLKRNLNAIRHPITDDDRNCYDADNIRSKKTQCKLDNSATDDVNQVQLEKEQIHLTANILDLLEIGASEGGMGMVDVIKLAQQTVSYFFWSLYENNPLQRSTAVNRVYSMLARQCIIRKSSRTLALRELLEGAFYSYGDLFGAHSDNINSDTKKEMVSLMKLNQNHCSTRSILHAGIIGNGLQPPMQAAEELKPEMQQFFLGAIAACCKSDVSFGVGLRSNLFISRLQDIPTTIDGFSTVSLLLVEMVSTDVMYNGLPWPDEDFSKVTMERDLQIRRTFTNAPILWGLLGLVATYRPAICFTSVLLRALCASVLNQWRAKTIDKYQVTANNVELYDVTKKLLEVMSMGQLLPPPLSYLHTVIEYLDASEISIVLKECIWNYMKENVPSPVLYGVDSTGLHWRDSVAAKPYPHFVDPLRNIMQRKLPQLGTFYHQMFVLSELSENAPKKN